MNSLLFFLSFCSWSLLVMEISLISCLVHFLSWRFVHELQLFITWFIQNKKEKKQEVLSCLFTFVSALSWRKACLQITTSESLCISDQSANSIPAVPTEFVKFALNTMGLSSLPAPSEGVLNVILVNTALSISMLKCFVRLILHMVGIRLSWSSTVVPSIDSFGSSSELGDPNCGSSWNYLEMFRNRYPRIRFDKVQSSGRREHDCSVCLTQFEPESAINHLFCGHLFHTDCLEKWLDYWNITCPLCRTPLMSEEEKFCFW